MRTIGIRHRTKRTKAGEARPTQVAILEDGKIRTLDLDDETAELDFVLGRYPTSWGPVDNECDLSKFPEHHIKWREAKEKDLGTLHEHKIRKEGKKIFIAHMVPTSYEGFRSGDQVVMLLGGSGDNLAFALARHGEEIGASVFRVPPFILDRETNGKRDKEKDAEHLVRLFTEKPDLFYLTGPRDRDLIWLRECLRARVDAMKDRIKCEQRLRQRLTGITFCSRDGKFPEGDIEKRFEAAKANDVIYKAILKEEAARELELEKACEALDVYNEVFAPIEGCGPKLASRIIGAVITIRRFDAKPKFRAFCGVHLLRDGRFPRRRNGEVANWSGDCRQAFYLLGDQFNRRPDSEWGKRLLAAKEKYRLLHPETIEVEGKKRYTKGHIHKMATWYTIGKFAEHLFRSWWNLELAHELRAKVKEAA